ncbi:MULTISPECIES: DUF4434 domain-containing protein [Dictyoglomus]|jgi:hypothetical protein|uniref:DUF4434 domain-containing protein n=2 Tax=Dictyoglomaceae TaxID=203488 RepID=UPI0023559303|nr:DUF4434 domain-containing protein [Dictyoglomus turgidum]
MIDLTIIPGFRCSNYLKPEVRIYSSEKLQLSIEAFKKKEKFLDLNYEVGEGLNKIFLDFGNHHGKINLQFKFYKNQHEIVFSKGYEYEIINSGCKSTTLIDGCWVSIYHWSEDEGRWFNEDLKNLEDEDWKQIIQDMNEIGIKGVIIQNVFYCNEYAGQHDMTIENYKGLAFYPSKIYPQKFPIKARDPIEAILSKADELNMNVFLGVGLFAWFDFSYESLKWHKNITKELWEMYGHHPSLYGWYISEEMFGSLYYEYPHLPPESYKDIVKFFEEYKDFVKDLTPTKPVALAPNNIRFHEFLKEWEEILKNVDIVIPFGFARDSENLNIDKITEVCQKTETHFWVDMEMFAWPIDNGLVPKTPEDLIKEIRMYDDVEQIYGYQYIGIMNSPSFRYQLGGEKTRILYNEYHKYYSHIKSKNSLD